MTTTRRAFLDVLRDMRTPEQPKDGDCLRWAPTITDAFVAAGYPAVKCVVTGRAEFNGVQAVAFIHHATKIGYLVIDCTARQFSPELPLRWVADLPQYIAGMVEHTGVSSVTVTEVQ